MRKIIICVLSLIFVAVISQSFASEKKNKNKKEKICKTFTADGDDWPLLMYSPESALFWAKTRAINNIHDIIDKEGYHAFGCGVSFEENLNNFTAGSIRCEKNHQPCYKAYGVTYKWVCSKRADGYKSDDVVNNLEKIQRYVSYTFPIELIKNAFPDMSDTLAKELYGKSNIPKLFSAVGAIGRGVKLYSVGENLRQVINGVIQTREKVRDIVNPSVDQIVSVMNSAIGEISSVNTDSGREFPQSPQLSIGSENTPGYDLNDDVKGAMIVNIKGGESQCIQDYPYGAYKLFKDPNTPVPGMEHIRPLTESANFNKGKSCESMGYVYCINGIVCYNRKPPGYEYMQGNSPKR